MFKRRIVEVLLLFTAVSVSGCTATQQNGIVVDYPEYGLGGVDNAFFVQDFGGSVAGRIVDTMDGEALEVIVKSMDTQDQTQLMTAIETGWLESIQWLNPMSKNDYKVTSYEKFQSISAQVCWKSDIEAIVDGSYQIVLIQTCEDAQVKI